MPHASRLPARAATERTLVPDSPVRRYDPAARPDDRSRHRGPAQNGSGPHSGSGHRYISCSHQPRVSTSAASASASRSAISSPVSSMPRARTTPST